MNEANIIRKILAGDTNAYEHLVTRYHVGLIIHCERLVGDRDQAEDVAQDAFIGEIALLYLALQKSDYTCRFLC